MKHLLFMSQKMDLGGTEKSLLSLLNALTDKSVKVTVLLLEDGGLLRNSIPSWVKVKVLDDSEEIEQVVNASPISRIFAQLRNGKLLSALKLTKTYFKIKASGDWYHSYKQALKGKRFDYEADIAIAFAGPFDFISYFVLNHIQAKEKIQWIHFDIRSVLISKTFGQKFYPQFDKIFCVSENAKTVLVDYLPQLASKSFVFNNIVNKEELKSLAEQGATFQDQFKGTRILTLGRLSPEKGQGFIPEVVQHLKEKGFKFRWYLIGEGALRADLESLIKKLEIEEHLILLGAEINPFHYMQDCDLYVQTSLHEGYCLTLHEAKMFDKPVVTTAVVSASNLIAHEEDGLIVPITAQSLEDAVEYLLSHPEKMEQFSKALLVGDTTDEVNKIL